MCFSVSVENKQRFLVVDVGLAVLIRFVLLWTFNSV